MSDTIIKLPNQKSDIEWTPYLATAYAEGFCEGESGTQEQQLEGWACLILTGMCWSLQGFFGRNASNLIANGFIEENGKINWEMLDE